MTLRLFQNATPKVNYFFNRMQIPSSIALALSHGSNDVQKSIGLIAMSLVILGFSPSFHVPSGLLQAVLRQLLLEQPPEDGKSSRPWVQKFIA